jgi:K+-transporting ATPase ATPase C chain
MWEQILPALRINLVLTVLLGVLYPLGITGISQLLFSRQANGSLVTVNGKTIGSELIAQNFTRPDYFHPRPSAADYDAVNSGGSNYGPMNEKLAQRAQTAIARFRQENPNYPGPLPADLVTASASGLDPHISPDSAMAQAARVAKARASTTAQMRDIVGRYTEGPDLGVFGEPRVNVLKLNLALDREYPRR